MVPAFINGKLLKNNFKFNFVCIGESYCYRFAIRWYLWSPSIPILRSFSFWSHQHSITEFKNIYTVYMKLSWKYILFQKHFTETSTLGQHRSDRVCFLGSCITIIYNVLSSVKKKKCTTLVLLPKYPAKLHILGYCKSEVF